MILITEFSKAIKGEKHVGKHRSFDFDEFHAFLKMMAAETFEGTKAQVKDKAREFTACQCKDGSRRLLSYPVSTMLVIDFDCNPDSVVDMVKVFSRYSGRRLLYTTPSHETMVPRFRICIPLSRTVIDRDEWKRMAGFFIDHYYDKETEVRDGKGNSCIDRMASCSMVHLWKAPCNDATVMAVDGKAYEPYIPPAPALPPAIDLSDMITYPEGKLRAVNYVKAAIRNVQDELNSVGEGYRNQAINSAAHGLARFIASGLLNEAEIENIIINTGAFMQIAEEDGLNTAKSTLRSGLQAGKRKAHCFG